MPRTDEAERQPRVNLRVPTWFVSTAHAYMKRTSGSEGVRRPYGTHHARQVGSPLTACGLGAFSWELFWEAPFPDEETESCRECSQVVANHGDKETVS